MCGIVKTWMGSLHGDGVTSRCKEKVCWADEESFQVDRSCMFHIRHLKRRHGRRTNKNSKLVVMIWSGAACIWSPKDRWSAVHNWWSTVDHEKLSWSARFEIDQKCLNSNNVHVSIMWVVSSVFWVPTCPLEMDAANKYQAVYVVVTIPIKDHTRKLCMVGSTTTSKDIAPNTAVHVRFGRCGFR